jgi:hypothetical protein
MNNVSKATEIALQKEAKTSLQHQHNQLADVQVQLDILEHGSTGDFALVPFSKSWRKVAFIP